MKKKVVMLLALLMLLALPRQTFANETKLIAITFDDGPSKYTSGLLDELAERQVVVTFFMQGVNAERYQSVVKKAYEAGHQIASHTYNHPYLPKLSEAERQNQISRTVAIFNNAIGTENSYMLRPPYGSYNAQVLAQIGTPAILWSVDTLDWKSRNADAVYRSIVENSRDGSIILMHDLYPSTIEGALRGIDYLQSQGYELVTVSELLRRRGISAEAGHTYSSAYNKGTTLPGISAPQISCEAAGMLKISCSTPNAKIYYKFNDSTYSLYTEAVALPGSRPLEVCTFAALNLNGARSAQNRLLISELGNCFADVRPDSWYYEDVDQIVAAGLLTTNNNYFYPDELITEQTTAILIQRLTANPLAAAAANAASEQPLTRERLALLLYQAKQLMQPAQPLPNLDAAGALHWAVERGVFTDELNPAAKVTRAELAAIVMRFYAA